MKMYLFFIFLIPIGCSQEVQLDLNTKNLKNQRGIPEYNIETLDSIEQIISNSDTTKVKFDSLYLIIPSKSRIDSIKKNDSILIINYLKKGRISLIKGKSYNKLFDSIEGLDESIGKNGSEFEKLKSIIYSEDPRLQQLRELLIQTGARNGIRIIDTKNLQAIIFGKPSKERSTARIYINGNIYMIDANNVTDEEFDTFIQNIKHEELVISSQLH